MEVTKLKFGKKTVVVEGSGEVKAVGSDRTYKQDFSHTCWAPPTEDFKDAISKLNEVAFTYLPLNKKKFASSTISSITLTQESDGYGLTFHVKAIINDDLPWNFNTPFLSSELLDAGIQDLIETIITEALKYEKGTFAPELDLSPEQEKEMEKVPNPSEKEESKKAGPEAVAA